MGKFCHSCGDQAEDFQLFCTSCGAKLEEKKVPEKTSVQPPILNNSTKKVGLPAIKLFLFPKWLLVQSPFLSGSP